MANNVINSGLNLMNTAFNGAGGIVISGDAVKGGYFVTDVIANIPSWSEIEGTLCFVTDATEGRPRGFYQFKGGKWTPLTLDDIPEGEGVKYFTPTYATKLDGIAEGANKYEHPAYTLHEEGLYKVVVSKEGHITGATAVSKSDITNLGIPAQDTTYSSLEAEENGTDVSLVTTGEKYIWNNHTHDYILKEEKGAANGVAPLGSDSKIAATYLPAISSDILEYNNQNDFPAQGESNKLYIAKNTNIIYRWTGEAYTPISSAGGDGDAPFINDNGNWQIGDIDTGVRAEGTKGKTAYEYAQEGGYTKSEAEFAAELGNTGTVVKIYIWEAEDNGDILG